MHPRVRAHYRQGLQDIQGLASCESLYDIQQDHIRVPAFSQPLGAGAPDHAGSDHRYPGAHRYLLPQRR
jgi:hypothetical protein